MSDDTSRNDEGEEFEPDASTIAFLDQRQAEFEGIRQDFLETYGFDHDCHCGEDYAAGRVGEITQCYHNMMQESLATCARLNSELKEMTGIAQALFQELKSRVESSDSEPEESSNVRVLQTETNSDGDSDRAADDAAGEGFGSARSDTGTDKL